MKSESCVPSTNSPLRRRLIGLAATGLAIGAGFLAGKGCFGREDINAVGDGIPTSVPVEPGLDDRNREDGGAGENDDAGDDLKDATVTVDLGDHYDEETSRRIDSVRRELAPYFDDIRQQLARINADLKDLEKGDPLPPRLTHAVCQEGVIVFAGPNGPAQEAQVGGDEEMPQGEDQYWLFQYTEQPTGDSSGVQIDYVPPAESDLDLAVIAKVFDGYDVRNGKGPNDECEESGTQTHRYSVETRDRDEPRITDGDRMSGKLCVEDTQAVKDAVGAETVIQEATALCDRIQELHETR